MSTTLSSSARRKARKDLIRLRMDMHRHQLVYHSRPLRKPLSWITGLFSHEEGHDEQGSQGTGWLAGMATMALTLFGKRLGRAGKLARVALMAYPLLQRMRNR